jgi:hypothetical protein
MNVKFPNNTSQWQMEFNSAFKGLKMSRKQFGLITHRGRGTLLVAQLVEALHYKPEGRRFYSRWCQ